MTDFRALCAELLGIFEKYDDESNLGGIIWDMKMDGNDLLERARASLAQPEPQDVDPWPMLGDAEGLAEVFWGRYDQPEPQGPSRPAIEPVPVSERLPGPEDCDAEGRCWYFFMDSVVGGCGWQMFNEEENELLAPSHFWLPHWALPLPGVDGADA